MRGSSVVDREAGFCEISVCRNLRHGVECSSMAMKLKLGVFGCVLYLNLSVWVLLGVFLGVYSA